MSTAFNTTPAATSIHSGQVLANKVAFIHGGSRGIGAATARRLAREGAIVAIGYASSATAAEALTEEIQAGGGHAIALKADATGSVVGFRTVDGKGVGVVVQFANGQKAWFFEDEIALA